MTTKNTKNVPNASDQENQQSLNRIELKFYRLVFFGPSLGKAVSSFEKNVDQWRNIETDEEGLKRIESRLVKFPWESLPALYAAWIRRQTIFFCIGALIASFPILFTIVTWWWVISSSLQTQRTYLEQYEVNQQQEQ